MSSRIYSCCRGAEAGALLAQGSLAAAGDLVTYKSAAPSEVALGVGDIVVLCETHYSPKQAADYSGALVLATETRPMPQKSDPATDPLTIQPLAYEQWVSEATLVTEAGRAFDPQAYINQILRGQE